MEWISQNQVYPVDSKSEKQSSVHTAEEHSSCIKTFDFLDDRDTFVLTVAVNEVLDWTCSRLKQIVITYTYSYSSIIVVVLY